MTPIQKALETTRKEDYNVLAILIHGSQNYELDTEKSDFDYRAIVCPTLDNLYDQTTISTKLEYEHGLIDVKDIRTYGQQLIKSNTAYLETLYAKEKIILNEDFQELLEIRDQIVVLDPIRHLNSCVGQTMEKRKAMCHPYPTLKEKIDKYGYDPKQLHHIVRLNELTRKYTEGYNTRGYDYTNCLIYQEEFLKYTLIDLKLEAMPLEEAIKMADWYIENTKNLVDKFKEKNFGINNETINKINTICLKITLKNL
jgi:predicted nucleotidyltransferase